MSPLEQLRPNTHQRFLVMAVILVVSFKDAHSFLLQDWWNCSETYRFQVDSCRCNDDTVSCSGLYFHTFPAFLPWKQHTDILKVEMNGLHLNSIPSNAFANINTTGSSNISIEFRSGGLTVIDNDAFAGIEDAITGLYLEDNKFTSVPAVIVKLKNLKRLGLISNPIINLDPLVFQHAHKNLIYLGISMGDMLAWPYVINQFSNLIELYMDDIPFRHIPLDAFSNLKSLEVLSIYDKNIDGIPMAVCLLHNLKELHTTAGHYNSPQQMLQVHSRCTELNAVFNIN